ncbi:MAG TPA: calcium-binding protein [Solirubrobacterales bacterium]|nr:calcium-binding protein [Solirubrobacterales bacterium]
MRRLLASLALAALALLLAAGTATPEGLIVLRGPTSETHLRLSVSGSSLLVTGPLSGASEGCSVRHGAATCSLAHAGAIEVDTGPADDKVEVLDPLPVPLTAYLGAGSDKFIGNAEPDTCYPQGTPRNRCIGEGGDDVCISAPVNTDCVGGAGDDYCRTGSGSDGCWGGPGNDVCFMGAGQDGCHGEGGNDRLFGGPGADQLYGGPGTDYCDGEPGLGKTLECELRPRRPRSPRSP